MAETSGVHAMMMMVQQWPPPADTPALTVLLPVHPMESIRASTYMVAARARWADQVLTQTWFHCCALCSTYSVREALALIDVAPIAASLSGLKVTLPFVPYCSEAELSEAIHNCIQAADNCSAWEIGRHTER